MAYNMLVYHELKAAGATLIGFADLSGVGEQERRGFKYGISIAIALNPRIVGEIPTGPHMEYYEEMQKVSAELKEISL